ncbi:uncharacterized protein BDV17DRAFT_275140 [Aspergillus undulatus]|uniref:uncharacterized protein n=1 Tax=Aspergillus undulatus TaxID=1810928 RepID=UPI003CCE41B9
MMMYAFQLETTYNPAFLHRAAPMESRNHQYHHMHVRHGQCGKDMEKFVLSDIMAGTLVRFVIAERGKQHEASELRANGEVVDVDTKCDLAIHVPSPIPAGYTGRSEVLIATMIRPNHTPIDAQIKALKKASSPCVFGDIKKNKGNDNHGFSLMRMMLAHGRELDKNSQYNFVLSCDSTLAWPLSREAAPASALQVGAQPVKHFPFLPIHPPTPMALRPVPLDIRMAKPVQVSFNTKRPRVSLSPTDQ